MDVGWTPRRVSQDDPQRMFAAVNLERDCLAVLWQDLALRLGCPDQAVDPGVIDLHGQPEPRIRRPAPFGSTGSSSKR